MDAFDFIKGKLGDVQIDAAMVLGSGLSGLADALTDVTQFSYSDLKGFPGFGLDGAKSSGQGVSGHGSELLIGTMGSKSVAILTGREHYYEHGNAAAMRPALETIHALGAKTLLLTNSAGSLDERVQPGELMMLSDHINYAGMNPLIGEDSDKRFVNLVDAYDPELRIKARQIASNLGFSLNEGVYLWYSGPSFETVAEIQMAIGMGANSVGMSTAPEVIIARMLGLKVWACSGITNMGAGMKKEEISHAQTKRVAAICAEKFEKLIPSLMETL